MKNNENIIIKPADKGSAIVILDKQSYINEGQRQLHNTQFCEQSNTDHTGEVINRINLHVYNMLQRDQISQSTCNYLTTDIDRTQQLRQPIQEEPKSINKRHPEFFYQYSPCLKRCFPWLEPPESLIFGKYTPVVLPILWKIGSPYPIEQNHTLILKNNLVFN